MTSIHYVLNNDEELEQIFKTHKNCVLFFNASWCGPCQSLKPALQSAVLRSEKLIKDINNKKIVFVSIDIEMFDELINYYGVGQVPTLILVSNSQTQMLPRDANQIVNFLERI